MTDYLIYWKDFWSECEQFGSDDAGPWNFHYHTRQARFFYQITPGENIWLVAFDRRQRPGKWYLVEKISVIAKKHKPRLPRPYQVIGSAMKSEFFDIRTQSDLTPVLKSLNFVSGKRITAEGAIIAQCLQTIRPLAGTDSAILETFAKDLTRISKLTEIFM